MRKLKLTVLALGATEVLSRGQMKNVLGGSAPGPSGCGTKDNCPTVKCKVASGPCKDAEGECGLSSHATACTCAAVCGA